jgi:hypothetical protein
VTYNRIHLVYHGCLFFPVQGRSVDVSHAPLTGFDLTSSYPAVASIDHQALIPFDIEKLDYPVVKNLRASHIQGQASQNEIWRKTGPSNLLPNNGISVCVHALTHRIAPVTEANSPYGGFTQSSHAKRVVCTPNPGNPVASGFA